MQAFNFNPETGEFVGVTEADPDPKREGRFLFPAFSTELQPPATAIKQAAIFDQAAKAWSVVPDFRTTVLYSTVDGTPVQVAGLGPQPPNTTEIPRPSPVHVWGGADWEVDPALEAAARVPASVTPLQARRALLAAGLLDAVETAIEGADPETKLAWQYATAVERQSPFTLTLAAALNLTDAQVDDLFVNAAAFV